MEDDIPTDPNTPKAMESKLRVMIPTSGQLTSGELRDFVIIFTKLGNDIAIMERRVGEQDKKLEQQNWQIAEIHKVIGRIDSLCTTFQSTLENFMTEIRRQVRGLAK